MKRRRRHPNHRRVKIHRSYTVEEIAGLFGTHKNTVREWIKAGLPTCDKRRPMLILGHDLASFLQVRRARKKQTCRPGEIYCVRCRATKCPAGDMADYVPATGSIGNLVAICPDCGSIINRRVSLAKLEQVRGRMDIMFPQALRQLVDICQSSTNSDLKEGTWQPPNITPTTKESNVGTSHTRRRRNVIASRPWMRSPRPLTDLKLYELPRFQGVPF